MSKKTITLTIDEQLSERAKEIAERNGVSVSQLVEKILKHLDRSSETPLVKGNVPDDYEPSEWARAWRGAFVTPGSNNDDHGDVGIIVEEILRKHS